MIITEEHWYGWFAYADGLCWCDECRRINIRGSGYTESDAIADYQEKFRNIKDTEE